MLLNTVVVDAYSSADRWDLHEALEDLTAGTDFSPNGIYCFWDVTTREVLYLGLSKDLAQRFKQHNNESSKITNGDKHLAVNAWFETHDVLGYSVILQSAMGTGDTHEGTMPLAEGQLIEGHRQARGCIPAWNKIGGSKLGAQGASDLTGGWFDLLTSVRPSLQVSRRTIRQLANDDMALVHECNLWSARMQAGMVGAEEGIDDQDIISYVKEMADPAQPWGHGFTELFGHGYMLQPQPFYDEST